MRTRYQRRRLVLHIVLLAGLLATALSILAPPGSADPWPERPADEGWEQGLVCPSRYSATRTIGVQNLTSVPFTLGARGISCRHWSNTGNPSQITGSLLSPAQTAPSWWSLERALYADNHAFDIGFFVLESGGGLSYRGELRFGLRSIYGEPVLQTNTGRQLENGHVCRQVSLGPDPNQWRTRQEFHWGPFEPGNVSRKVTIYSDGVTLFAVRCGRRSSGRDPHGPGV